MVGLAGSKFTPKPKGASSARTMEIMKKNVERQLHTPKGREMGEQRKRLMKAFLKGLKEEL